MSTLWQSPVLILALAAWLAAPPRTLGEAAEREALRRKAMPKAHTVLTNVGQPLEVPLGAVTPPNPATTDPGKAGEDPSKKDEPKKDETWWRKRITDAREALVKQEALVETLQTRINGLQRDFLQVSGGPKVDQIRMELNSSIAEQEVAKRQVETYRRAITDIQEEARRSNVPPGWIR